MPRQNAFAHSFRARSGRSVRRLVSHVVRGRTLRRAHGCVDEKKNFAPPLVSRTNFSRSNYAPQIFPSGRAEQKRANINFCQTRLTWPERRERVRNRQREIDRESREGEHCWWIQKDCIKERNSRFFLLFARLTAQAKPVVDEFSVQHTPPPSPYTFNQQSNLLRK